MIDLYRIFLILFLFIIAPSCIEEFVLNTPENKVVFVVDGKITNEDTPFLVKLYSSSLIDGEQFFEEERDAVVIIHDDVGNELVLTEETGGIYRGDQNNFRGIVGRTYWITIERANGEVYESLPDKMNSPVVIDSLYGIERIGYDEYGKDIKAVDFVFDVSIFENSNTYLRWEYFESWEWHASYLIPDFTKSALFYRNDENICYPFKNSNKANVFNASNTLGKEVKKLTIITTTEEEVKLKYEYALQSKVYSISKNSFEFWQGVERIENVEGDLFDEMPSNINGNVIGCSDKCLVIGLFEASAVSTATKVFMEDDFNVDFAEIDPECFAKEVANEPIDTINYKILFIRPDPVSPTTDTLWTIVKSYCLDCSKKYPTEKPSIWFQN